MKLKDNQRKLLKELNNALINIVKEVEDDIEFNLFIADLGIFSKDLYEITNILFERSDFMNLINTKNAGYTIIKQGEKAVLGVRTIGDYTEYVAWNYNIRNGKADYFWGRYGLDLQDITDRFNKKENGE